MSEVGEGYALNSTDASMSGSALVEDLEHF
jgi:hypothetical protein